MKRISESRVQEAVHALQRGGVVAFPTETAYGLGADATNTRAVKKVFAMKGREAGKTPPLIVASFAMAERCGVFTSKLRRLARQFWPGPLTIVVEARPGSGLSRAVIRKDGTIAFRVSSGQIAQTLSRRLKAPVVATSANRAGAAPCYSAECVRKSFTDKLAPDVILDGGTLRRAKPSTIITEIDGEVRVLRKGPISLGPNTRIT